ncbi:MAG: alpha/beta fold hydrolase [Planctomycetota bacterium]|jgi:alpha-beta hydrolase superfamily lysophospholipase
MSKPKQLNRFMDRPHGSGKHLAWSILLGACLAAAGCETPLATLDPNAEPVAYYVSDDPNTVREVKTYLAADGQELAYVYHRRVDTKANAAIVYLHGIESHAGWFDEAADMLCRHGYDVFCLDRRGSGMNRENRGLASGHIESWEQLLSDVEAFVKPLGEQYDTVALTGLSWGGKLALAYGLTYPDQVDGLVLVTPGMRSRVSGEACTALQVLFSAPDDPVKIPIEPEMFTETPVYPDKLRRDPLRLHYATAKFFIEGVELDRHIDKMMPTNALPILLVLAGKDQIIDNPAVTNIVKRGKQEILDIVIFSDQTHSVQFDAPARLVRQIVGFCEDHVRPGFRSQEASE